jgi:hypothetical protein
LAALANPLGYGAHAFMQGCAGLHVCCWVVIGVGSIM